MTATVRRVLAALIARLFRQERIALRSELGIMDSDYLATAMAAGDSAIVIAARTTRLVADAQARHGCGPTVTAALGRLLTGAALMGASLSGRDRIALQVTGDGPVCSLTAEVMAGGRVRGYPESPDVDVPLNARGKFDVARLVGRGSLHVTRTFSDFQPYTSAVRMVSGEIGEDLAHYFASSEQIPTIVALGVLAGPSGVVASGGLLLQLLPGADEATIRELESRVHALPAVSGMIRDGAPPEALIQAYAGALSPRATGTHELRFACPCDRERVVKALLGLGRPTLESMIAEDDETEARCDFCSEVYRFSRAELRDIVTSATTST
jgi:molecular chaperone Hsp33